MTSTVIISGLASRLVLALALALVASGAGCHGDTAGNVSMAPADGGILINGHPFAALGEGAVQVSAGGGDGGDVPAGFVVELIDQYNGCNAIISPLPNETVLQFHFPQQVVGTFDVGIGNTVFSVGTNLDAATPRSGKLVVLTANAQHIAGTYDVTFESGEHLAGSFDAPICL